MPGEADPSNKPLEPKDEHVEKLKDSKWGLLYSWIAGRPNWVQNTAILTLAIALAVGAGTYTFNKVSGWIGEKPTAAPTPTPTAPPKPTQVTAAGSIYPKGVQGDPPPGHPSDNNPTLIAAGKKLIAESKHGEWHETHREDPSHPEKEPPWQTISRDPNNYIMYRYYPNTDKCVAILRKANGVASPTQWLQDPNYIDGLKVQTPSSQSSNRSSDSPEKIGHRPAYDTLPPIATAQFRLPDIQLTPQNLQESCADPHPGAFTWWWGPPANECWSPMYRRFGDGCTHYQLFNRCSNAWDGRIFWVSCTPGPNGHHY